jgi:thiol-disulfide isomerase/thioredoxin
MFSLFKDSKRRSKSRTASRTVKRTPSRKNNGPASAIDVRSTSQIPALESILKSGPVALVLVYADWCGHCVKYKPMWESLAATPGRVANMAAVREDVFQQIPSIAKAKIQGYPSVIKVSPNGNIENFKTPGSNETTNAIDSKDMRDEGKMRNMITANAPNTPESNRIHYNVASNNSADDEENNDDIFTPVTSLAGKPGFANGSLTNSNMLSMNDSPNYQNGGALALAPAFMGAIQAASPAALLLAAHALLPRGRTFRSPKRSSRRASTRRASRRAARR